jgi:predicted dehydrogenase
MAGGDHLLHLGLVGYGRFGKEHVTAIEKTPGVKLAAICAGSEESMARARTEHPSSKVYLDYEAFLSEGGLDLVDIVSPNYLHARQAVQAIQKKKNVLLEKPVATSIEDARELVLAARQNDSSQLKIQVGFEFRYSPFWRHLKEVISQGSLGPLTFGRIDSWRFPFRTGSRNWKYDREKIGHHLLEEAVHYVDLANWFLGEHDNRPVQVWCTTDSEDSWKTGFFKTAVMLITYEGGQKFLIGDTLNGFGSNLSVSLTGESGALLGMVSSESDVSGNLQSLVKMKDGRSGAETTLAIPDQGELHDLASEIEDFAACVRKVDQQPTVTLKDGFAAASVCFAAIRSMKSKTTEVVEKFP